MARRFEFELMDCGWSPAGSFCYRKGSWELVFDTSSWMELGTQDNPRVFDGPVPEGDWGRWTIRLIDHLAQAEDELHRLRRADPQTRTSSEW